MGGTCTYVQSNFNGESPQMETVLERFTHGWKDNIKVDLGRNRVC
jgi:hypothetical protein